MSVRDAKTGAPLPQKKQPGYYPGYSTLSQRKFWDAATRELVESRVRETPEIRFFTPEELPLVQAVCSRVLPQHDRLPEWRIPIVEPIDERLFCNRIHGFRFEDMPSDQEAYRLGLKAIDATAVAMHGRAFIALTPMEQDEVLKSIVDGKKVAGDQVWKGLSIQRFWALLVQDCASAYYAHPWAWDEIGYGGPAYPRAYTRLEGGMAEPWEKDEVRYEWLAPEDSLSDALTSGEESGSSQSHPAQGGTH